MPTNLYRVWSENDNLIARFNMPKIILNAKAPDFILEDFNGNVVQLSKFRGEKNVVLIFNRGFT
jgi:hypothetical protein